jgi:hypothetical protein
MRIIISLLLALAIAAPGVARNSALDGELEFTTEMDYVAAKKRLLHLGWKIASLKNHSQTRDIPYPKAPEVLCDRVPTEGIENPSCYVWFVKNKRAVIFILHNEPENKNLTVIDFLEEGGS